MKKLFIIAFITCTILMIGIRIYNSCESFGATVLGKYFTSHTYDRVSYTTYHLTMVRDKTEELIEVAVPFGLYDICDKGEKLGVCKTLWKYEVTKRFRFADSD